VKAYFTVFSFQFSVFPTLPDFVGGSKDENSKLKTVFLNRIVIIKSRIILAASIPRP
jgi:hypothetical protein